MEDAAPRRAQNLLEMATTRSKPTKRTPTGIPPARDAAAQIRALERRVRRAEAALAQERERHERRLDAVRRAANRRLAAMMQEIAVLRHHEARADALSRLLDEREPLPARDHTNGKDPRLPG
jgi:uncharacterized protein YlxW (UPF0749 family)